MYIHNLHNNNNGLFRIKSRKGRIFIRRSKIYHNYRPLLKHRRIRRKILNGSGDEKSNSKHIDFKELEQIFDNAIQNHRLYKDKSQENSNPIDTRIELSNIESNEEMKCCFIYNIKQYKIFLAIIFITFSTLIGFFSVFIFIK